MERAKEVKSNPASDKVGFAGKTIIVTGAGAGLGRAYAIMYGKLGGNVVVNDVNQEVADKVSKEVEQGAPKWFAVLI